MRVVGIMFAAIMLVVTALQAQWLNYPTPGIPRLPDGKPNLTAPAPKTTDNKPDLTGLWKAPGPRYLFDLAADLPDGAPFQPWAAALYKQRLDNLAKERPSG